MREMSFLLRSVDTKGPENNVSGVKCGATQIRCSEGDRQKRVICRHREEGTRGGEEGGKNIDIGSEITG